jgi:hypothetical protein
MRIPHRALPEAANIRNRPGPVNGPIDPFFGKKHP